jgi:hypothetical protein
MELASWQDTTTVKVNNATRRPGTVSAVNELRGTTTSSELGAAYGPAGRSPGAQCELFLPAEGNRGSGSDWSATAEQLADVAQSVAGVELTTEARSALTGMTVELLTMLTCWPNTSRPAHALAYLRTRRARTVPHAPWFYQLPRHVRWFVGGGEPGDSPPRLRLQRAGHRREGETGMAQGDHSSQ